MAKKNGIGVQRGDEKPGIIGKKGVKGGKKKKTGIQTERGPKKTTTIRGEGSYGKHE